MNAVHQQALQDAVTAMNIIANAEELVAGAKAAKDEERLKNIYSVLVRVAHFVKDEGLKAMAAAAFNNVSSTIEEETQMTVLELVAFSIHNTPKFD